MRSSPTMELRTARLSDVEACAALDASYSTEHTWQLTQERPLLGGSGELTVGLRTVRLPRARTVTPPDPLPELEAEWDSTDLWLIAELDGVIGYVCVEAPGEEAWLRRLVVAPAHRRSGIATAMLGAASQWARANGLRCVLAAAPAKNYPVISLLRARAYNICGYNERHFPSGDVAIYLALDIPRR